MHLTHPHLLDKVEHIAKRYEAFRFETLATIPVEFFETKEYLDREPGDERGRNWRRCPAGTKWGGPWKTAWFRGRFAVPKEAKGRSLFLRHRTSGPWSKTGCRESMVFVDGAPLGAVDREHAMALLTTSATPGKRHRVSVETYSGHDYPGHIHLDYKGYTFPEKCHTFDGLELVAEREDVSALVLDLQVLLDLLKILDKDSLRYGRIVAGLAKAWEVVRAMPDELDESEWRPPLADARRILKPLLACENGPTTPRFGVVGHSHLDTIWLWTYEETIRKAARTFSTQLALMDKYPEFVFVQSAPCHIDMISQRYPDLVRRIKQRVKEGRWEPNGAMYVESDLMCASGEALARQFLWGQMKTREWFGYTADTAWLPDDFGFSGALPQLMKGAGVEFFCTQKIRWNDTTKFAYNTFRWQGIDGTEVLAHQIANNSGNPMPTFLDDQWRDVENKDVMDRRLLPMGYGDGGGGPTADMMEIMQRVRDLEGSPRAEFTTVSAFMRGIRDEIADLPAYRGEIYLEAHRGTQTAKAAIKRANRKAEIALRDAEMLATLASLAKAKYPTAELTELWRLVLVNDFHDAVPGTSIAEANDRIVAELEDVRERSETVSQRALERLACGATRTRSRLLVFNTLSWERTGELEIADARSGMVPDGATAQWVEGPDGAKRLAVSDIALPPLGAAILEMRKASKADKAPSPFTVNKQSIQTPFARIRFDRAGRIASFVDLQSGRDLVEKGDHLNVFEIGEDVPYRYDVWEIDAAQQRKMAPDWRLENREIVADGPLQLRLRSAYRIGDASSIVQDMVFHATTPRVDFETVVDWHDRRKLLRATFDFSVLSDTLRSEVQFGFVDRPTHANQPADRARFEVSQHRYSDLSETGFGVALLNDCKYSVHVDGSHIGLSLIKAGTQPDARCEEGIHRFTYAILPHDAPFSATSVVQPASEFNVAPLACPAGEKAKPIESFVTVDAPNVIVETVKQAESDKAVVLRIYEAEKTGATARLEFHTAPREIVETNLLEEPTGKVALRGRTATIAMRPFEIKTLLCRF